MTRIAGTIAGISALLLTASASQAQVLVTGSYNQVGMNFFYSFQVANQSGLDVLVADVIIPNNNAFTITNELAPAGFQINVDAVTGRIGLIGDSSVFTAGTTVNGFSLRSSGLLPNSEVEVTTVNGPGPNGTFTSVAVPEAGTLPLVVLAGSALFGTVIARRRRNVAQL